MRKILKIIVVLFFIAFIALQFVRPERTNPQIIESETFESSTKTPEYIGEMFKRSCKDCHSNATEYPFYSNIAPISWSVVDHIRVGRENLNFSIWNTYSKEKKLRKLEEICEEVKSGNMPHNQYLWIHWNAVLSEEDRKNLCVWTEKESDKIKNES